MACDICSKPFNGLKFDARTYWGQWANLCFTCFVVNGVGLGIGCGQAYSQVEGKWVKIKG